MAGWRISRKVIGPSERPMRVLPSAPKGLFHDECFQAVMRAVDLYFKDERFWRFEFNSDCRG